MFYQVPEAQAVYYAREIAQSLPMTDILKYSSKQKGYTLDPKTSVNFTRTAGTATSYSASTIKT